MPGILQPVDHGGDRAALVQRVLVEVDVEIGPEQVQRRLDLVEHQLDAGSPVELGGLGVGQARRLRDSRGDPRRDLRDVVAAVAVVRRRQAAGRSQQRTGEPLDLRARVVEVVLPDDRRALGAQHPAERVADRCPPGAADVDRAGRVRRDELEVDLLPGQRIPAAVGRARLDDAADQRTGRGGLQGDVEKARPGDLHSRDAGPVGQVLGDGLGDLARRPTR